MKAFIGLVSVLGLACLVVLYNYSSTESKSFLSMYQLEESEFQDYLSRYDKSYSGEEYVKRFKIFRDNVAYMKIENMQGHSHTLGINKFTDMTREEFAARYFNEIEKRHPDPPKLSKLPQYPPSVDWRASGAVTGVKDQSPCPCGWAFATTGVMEGAWAIAGHGLASLSEQQLLDCSDFFGNNGCNGGYVSNSLSYVLQYGLTSEGIYPYTGNPTLCNSAAVADVVARLTIYNHITQQSSAALLTAVALGPIAVDVMADS